MIETEKEADLEAWLDKDIVCQGTFTRRNPICPQSAPAQLRSNAHGHALNFKCVSCWQKWLAHNMRILTSKNYLTCPYCGDKFHSIEDFSDYRPF